MYRERAIDIIVKCTIFSVDLVSLAHTWKGKIIAMSDLISDSHPMFRQRVWIWKGPFYFQLHRQHLSRPRQDNDSRISVQIYEEASILMSRSQWLIGQIDTEDMHTIAKK